MRGELVELSNLGHSGPGSNVCLLVELCRSVTKILGFGRARPASLELAFGAFKDEPVRARMAHVAVPEDEGGVGLDHLEGMLAFAWFAHGVGVVS